MSQKSLREMIAEAFVDDDPMGLISMGAPADEYDGEVDEVMERLSEGHPSWSAELLQEIIHDVFLARFDKKLVGPPGAFVTLAQALWLILRDP